ncbi:MAG TPA: PAS domain S-box protein [Candidatus Kapabacteria bacterium]|nr:PAS domain S-box protein [Candidatus Kapabacteria bacterium]
MAIFATATAVAISAIISKYAIFSLAGVLVNVTLATIVFIKDPHSTINRLWSVALACIILWASGEFVNRIIDNASVAEFINRITGTGFCILPSFFLHFSLAFSHQEQLLKRRSIYALIYGTGIFFTLMQLMGYVTTATHLSWGFTPDPTTLYWYYIIWLELFFAVGFFFCYKKFRATSSNLEQKQALVVVVGVLFPLVIGSATDAFLPLFGIEPLRIAVLTTTITAGFITYGIIKYQLMSLTPETTARVLLDTMSELLAVTDRVGTVVFSNETFRNVIGIRSGNERRQMLWDFMAYDDSVKAFMAKERHADAPLRSMNLETEYKTSEGRTFPVLLSVTDVHDREELAGFVFLAHDITERKHTEDALHEAYQFNQQVISSAGEGIVVYDKQLQYVVWNSYMEKLTGLAAPEVLGKHSSDVFPDWESSHADGLLYKSLTGQRTTTAETPFHIPSTKHAGYITAAYEPLRDAHGEVIGVIGVINDITERKKTEQQLFRTQSRLSTILDHLPGVVFYETDGNTEFMSDNIYSLTGHPKDSSLNKRDVFFTYIHPEDWEHYKKRMDEWIAGDRSQALSSQFRFRHADGQYIWLEDYMVNIPSKDGQRYISGVIIDITKNKTHEQEIKKSLDEKTILLKEVHHRVKNNLQIITSLLNLQAGYITDKEALALFLESQSRVKSMALIHENLYQSNDLANIDFHEYVCSLAAFLTQSYGHPGNITLDIDVKNIYLSIDIAIPCGLIVNELVSNAFKYAFRGRDGGTIRINLEEHTGDTYILCVADNGAGFPENINFRDTTTLGLQLVTALTSQLRGKIQLLNGQGTTFTVTFPRQHIRPSMEGERIR